MTIVELLNQIGEEVSFRIVKILELNNKVATGNLVDSIEYIVGNTKDGKYTLKVLGDYYLKNVNYGRRPGKFVPVSDLKEWMKVRNIPEQYSYPINQKIKRDGIKGLFFLERVLKDIETQYGDELESLFGEVYEVELYNIFKNNMRTKTK
jgi:hypothetical protein